MVEGLVKLMNSEYNDVFNLGSPYEIRINDLANLVKKIANSKSKIVFRPLPEDDPKKRNPDISKARKKLGWKPKIDLENGLKKTIEWYKNNRWWLEKII
jgi:nucleoside-diphosphate-sugar epimerase